uniref:DDE Tnp4 domain-containing protein n=1 Tax=Ditylenchus dipsaci TaxID=166011 RepID=A0A915D812_9BILA
MKPFSGHGLSLERRRFNYRMSRCRRLIENVFGMLALKWRIVLSGIEARPETADWIVKAAVCLHNFILEEHTNYDPRRLADDGDEDNGIWRLLLNNQLPNISCQVQAPKAGKEAILTRETLVNYLSGRGSVDWQEKMI